MSEEKEVVQEVTSEMVYNEFFRLVDNAAGLNILHRNMIGEDVRKAMHPVQYAFEFCTVHIDIGRRIGKTEYIKKNLTDGVIVIVSSNEIRKSLLKETGGGNGAVIINGNTSEPVLINDLLIRNPNFIFIDEPSLISDKNIGVIYHTLVRKDLTQLFILLGK